MASNSSSSTEPQCSDSIMELSELVELLSKGKSSDDIVEILKLESARAGLQKFRILLILGVELSEDGKAGIQSWDSSQIQAVCSVGCLLTSAVRPLLVVQVEPIVIEVLLKSLELALQYLERAAIEEDDLIVRNKMVHLLELATVGADKDHDSSRLNTVDNTVDKSHLRSLSELFHKCTEIQFESNAGYNLTGWHVCSKEQSHINNLLCTLSSEFLQSNSHAAMLLGSTLQHDTCHLPSFSLHMVVVHNSGIQRLIVLCKDLAKLYHARQCLEIVTDSTFCMELALVLRIFKLVALFARESPYAKYNGELWPTIALFADVLPYIFMIRLEVGKLHDFGENRVENLALFLAEEFLHLMQVIFCNSCIPQNMKAHLAASIWDTIDAWRCSESSMCSGLPLACFPSTVLFSLKLIHEIKDPTHPIFVWKGIQDNDVSYISRVGVHDDSCSSNDEHRKVYILKESTADDLLQIVMYSPKQWVHNLLYLVSFLHEETDDLRSDVSQEQCTSTRTLNSNPENPNILEDEAIFGYLFSEAIHSVGSNDAASASKSVPTSSMSSYCCHPIHAAVELLAFLRLCISSADKVPFIYDDCLEIFCEDQINVFYRVLSCTRCSEDTGSLNGGSSPKKKRATDVHNICFEILHTLIVRQTLSVSVLEYLVHKTMNVENGLYVYNVYLLALLAHAIISRCSWNSQLTFKLFKGFADFITEKARVICSQPFSLQEVVNMLPSVFHVEILMVAFYLSPEAEKATLANFLFSSVSAVDSPPPHCSNLVLTHWGLLVSRIILMLRQIIAHPHACPQSLFLCLQSKITLNPRQVLHNSDHLHECSFHWVSVALESAFDLSVKQDPEVKIVLGQMIDHAPFPSLVCGSDVKSQFLQLNWVDLYENFSHMLGIWTGREAVTVMDLIVERYMFTLCWDMLQLSTAMDHKVFSLRYPQVMNPQVTDSQNVKFFYSSSALVGQFRAANTGIDAKDVLIEILEMIRSSIVHDNLEDSGWDFLRRGFLLCLVLSSMDIGLQLRNSVSTVGVLVHSSEDNEFIVSAEGFISYIFDSGKIEWIMKILSSLLNKYLRVYKKCIVLLLEKAGYGSDGFSPVSLLMLAEIDKNMYSKIIEKNEIIASLLEFHFSFLKRFDGAVERKARGITSCILWEGMLHGFPSMLQTSSSALLSCILNIRRLVGVLHGFFRAIDADKNATVDSAVLCQNLDSLMHVNSDKIFSSIHVKCEATYCILTRGLTPGYCDLFPLKNMEGFLKDLNVHMIDGEICEWGITWIVEFLDMMRKDPLKITVFNFYCGAGVSQRVNELFASQRGDLMVLMDSLDNCHNEIVNVKVLGFMVDILSGEAFPDLKQKIKNKFYDMDLIDLSHWLEKRFLGHSVASSTMPICMKASPFSLRESTTSFVACLISSQEEEVTKLKNHIFDALLLILDKAFMQFDIYTAKFYLSFVSQLSSDEKMIKSLLSKILSLVGKLSGKESLFPSLKCVINFLGCALCGAPGSTSGLVENLEHQFKSDFPLESQTKSMDSSKGSAAIIVSSNQDDATVEYDATSIDDEDDGTSDGETASVDKNDEEEVICERLLASKLCTFTSTGSNFMEQHWYFCYTCDLTRSKGCCSVCVKVCHRGHRVVYSRLSRFFCDCGAGGVRGNSCQCLEPRKITGSNDIPVSGSSITGSNLPLSQGADQLPNSDSEFEDTAHMDLDNSIRLSLTKEIQEGVLSLFLDLGIESIILKICLSILSSVLRRREINLATDSKIVSGHSKILANCTDLLRLKKSYKSGSLDLKVKVEHSRSKDPKSNVVRTSVFKSLLSLNSKGRLAVGEGDKVGIFDVGQLISQASITPTATEKISIKSLSKNVMRFEIVHLMFSPDAENYLAVAGYEDCQILSLNSRGEVFDRLPVELSMQGGFIKSVHWVPGSQVQLAIVTNKFVKIYDLSKDNISPVYYITVPDRTVVDACLNFFDGKLFILVLPDDGNLFKLELSMDENCGARQVEQAIKLQDGIDTSKGSSIFFSSMHQLVFISYEDGTSVMGRLSPDLTFLTEISYIHEDVEDKMLPAGLYNWKELSANDCLFACFSSLRSNAGIVVKFGSHEIHAQDICRGVGSTSPIVGMVYYKSYRNYVLSLHEDGCLQIHTHLPSSCSDVNASMASEKVKRLGSDILNCNKAYNDMRPEFSLDFFEKTVCITEDVKLGSDAVKNCDSEKLKQKLSSEDGFLEACNLSGFQLSVSNLDPDIAMVGFRVQVGCTSVNHIPSNIAIFKRVFKLDEGLRSWYDIPFTVTESLLADEEFTMTIGPTYGTTVPPRIDSLEVYGRAKDEFGWKEKLNAVLDVEACDVSGILSSPGRRKKLNLAHSPSIEEQVLADVLHLLYKFYMACRKRGCLQLGDSSMEISKLGCRDVLNLIFESDREPVIRSVACHILHAICPVKEIYHQVKDTMRLLGVVKSMSLLLSKSLNCNTIKCSVIDEFICQMRAVTRIAVRRKQNLVSFLETNGSMLINLLMQFLWVLLDIGLLEAQTIKNIVITAVEFIYSYAECLVLQGKSSPSSVSPAVLLLKKLLFSNNEAVQASSSLAISSGLLQVPFPKQTMLAADDFPENVVSGPADPLTAGRTNQVVVEEDNITSVQYCCDGCSTVPILRRRWHCTVCPDFDLCETCYEALDADRLPLPHSRDHPMAAMAIEVESTGDGSEISFPPLKSRESVSPTDGAFTHVQRPSPPTAVHGLKPEESSAFSPDADQILISASKRAVNSLLLAEFLESMKGCITTTRGAQAIPVLQLFYRLSSIPGGPFVDSPNPEILSLEKLVDWLLDEINIDKPFVSESRSLFGEVVILVFMFFTLILRNWNQSSSDNPAPNSTIPSDAHADNAMNSVLSAASGSQHYMDEQKKFHFASQMSRACSVLRKQAFANYLMDLLQKMMGLFRSPAADAETADAQSGSGCGSLLAVKRDRPAGNFYPFFSDSYVRAHHDDIFSEYHKLLLENTFRLLYNLVRPEKHDRAGDRDKPQNASGKELKLEDYQDVLCFYINNPHTSFARRYARRLFLHLCGSKTSYYSVRDAWQHSTEFKSLSGYLSKTPTDYDLAVKIVQSLSNMVEPAASRPRNWQKYCSRHADVLSFLLSKIFCLGEDCVVRILKLLSLALYTGKDMSRLFARKGESSDPSQTLEVKRKSRDSSEPSSEKPSADAELVVSVFDDGSVKRLVDHFLLEWNSSAVRNETKFVLYGLWHHGNQPMRESLLAALMQKFECLPSYGLNITEYAELLTVIFTKDPDGSVLDRCLTREVVGHVFDTLRGQNELLANHPNSRIYNTLSGLVEFDGYYLENEPCVACSSPEVPYARMKLESLKSETKYTGNRIIVKCTGSYMIQTVLVNVHDAGKSKSVKVLNLYYNNWPVADMSELKNEWSLWKRAKSCRLAFNQTELKVDFIMPITACNFMIELDSFYENLQALSLEVLQCPRCSQLVTDKHGICGNCHENAYQCRQCRNINYENIDSFLCNECGYSKYGRFEFNFMAKPSYAYDEMENDEDMRRGLLAIESESENAHKKYQQLLGLKKPLLKIVSAIGDSEVMDLQQQKDAVQQMMLSLSGPLCKINRRVVLLGVLYGEKCKTAFDSVSRSVQTLQGIRRVLMKYLRRKHYDAVVVSSRNTSSACYGCASTFVTECLGILLVLSKHPQSKQQLVSLGILGELFESNLHRGSRAIRSQTRAVLAAFSQGDAVASSELNGLVKERVVYFLEHHRSMDVAIAVREDLMLLSELCASVDDYWESRLRIVFFLLFTSIKAAAKHPVISDLVIFPCMRIIIQACTPPPSDREEPAREDADRSIPTEPKTNAGDSSANLLSYSEWERGSSYVDFVRRQYKATQGHRAHDYIVLKYGLRWKRRACARAKPEVLKLELGSWVKELLLSPCSQPIRSEMCALVDLLFSRDSIRRFRLLNLLIDLLPSTLSAGESAAEYFDLLFRIVDAEEARLYLTVRRFLNVTCALILDEVGNVASLERSLHVNISQGFILHKLVVVLKKFLEVPNIRARFIRDGLLSNLFEALIVTHGLVVQRTKLVSDCNRLLKELLDGFLLENEENKSRFIGACVRALKSHGGEGRGRTSLFILDQLCNVISPVKPEPTYLLVLNKSHTQEEFIRGSMLNLYSSAEIGPLMRDVKNKICHQLDLMGLLEDDYGMELLVGGNIISLDLTIAQVYEQVWKKCNVQSQSSGLANRSAPPDHLPMAVTYRLQGLDGEATEPMIKELEEERVESRDPEVEFSVAGAVREYGGLEIILNMIKLFWDDLKENQEHLGSVLKLMMLCCKVRGNRLALLTTGAMSLLLETARRAFLVDTVEIADTVLLIVECLTLEVNVCGDELSVGVPQVNLSFSTEGAETGGEQAKKIVLMFLDRLGPQARKQGSTEMLSRILPYLTYGEPSAMAALIDHFEPYLNRWSDFDDSTEPESANWRSALESFVRVTESLNASSFGDALKDLLVRNGLVIAAVTHLSRSFTCADDGCYKSSDRWLPGLRLPSVPFILSILRGLSSGHSPTQACIGTGGVTALLHALEGVAGETSIGVRAENLLDTLSGPLADEVLRLRAATRDEMRRRALRKREELLRAMGMQRVAVPDSGDRIVASASVLEGLDDVEEEEEGLACMVCREGYGLRPSALLGAYTYSKRVNLGPGDSDVVYTTVSHFNLVHFQCHQEAKRADLDLRNPKKEWDGAALRNSKTLCNSLFPLRGGAVPAAQYDRHLDQHWDNLTALGYVDGTRLRLLVHDIVLMLARFATGASFSTDCKGGGRESNAGFLPFMLQMAWHVLDQSGPAHRPAMARAVAAYLTCGHSDDTVQYMMVASLLCEPYESWLAHRRVFLMRGIWHAHMQRGGAAPAGLAAIHPMLVYVGAIESMQRFLKADGGSHGWEAAVRSRLLDFTAMARFAKDFLPWLDTVMSAPDLETAFAAIGVTEDVVCGGFLTCQDFVHASISADVTR